MHRLTPTFALRLGLAFSFLYPAIAAIFNPFAWIGYFPPFLSSLFGNELILLHAFGALEVVIALLLLSGRFVFYASTAAAFLLVLIVFFNWSQMDVIFRDLSLAAMAVALALASRPGQERNRHHEPERPA